MTLHPEIASRLPLIADISRGGTLTPDQEQRMAAFAGGDHNWEAATDVSISTATIPGPHGDIPIRIYTASAPSGAYLLWAHGGGFWAGTLDWPEGHVVSAEVCARSGATVVSVDYRLAGPETRYPVPLDDVSAAWDWIVALAHSSTENPTLALGGASAGAALALAAALRNPASADAVILCYPFVHFPVPILSPETLSEMDGFPSPLRFSAESVENMVKGYVGRIHDLPPDALPGAAAVPSGMTPTHILIAEYDDLRPSGELLARQYAEAGVPVSLRMEPAVLHGHLNRYPGEPGVNESLDWMAGILRSLDAH